MKVKLKQKKHDYPKKAGELSLAWYAGGRICISRRKTDRHLQKQNLSIIQINAISKMLWNDIAPCFKKDLAQYALRYKKEYPTLRKRGVSSYAVFLILIHALIKRFSLKTDNPEYCSYVLKCLLEELSVKKAVIMKLLRVVSAYCQLNRSNVNRQIDYLSEKSLYSKNDYTNVIQVNNVKVYKSKDTNYKPLVICLYAELTLMAYAMVMPRNLGQTT